MEAEALVATTLPRRYMSQLCKHFQHRLAVTLGDSEGRIAFPAGPCELHVEDGGLRMRVTAADAAGLAGLQDVVARHLVRFGFRDELVVAWTPLGA